MKRRRDPYFRRLWTAIALVLVVVVLGFGVTGYEIHHLQTEVDGLKTQVVSLQGVTTYLTNLIREVEASK